MFTLKLNDRTEGISLVDEIDLAPAFLVECFGPPLDGDGYRVTGRYCFVSNDGEIFAVYDYKSTAAYLDDEAGALSPESFWASYVEQEFSVGGKGGYRDGSAKHFIHWLLGEHHRWRSAGR